jgi:hypothetical protein
MLLCHGLSPVDWRIGVPWRLGWWATEPLFSGDNTATRGPTSGAAELLNKNRGMDLSLGVSLGSMGV